MITTDVIRSTKKGQEGKCFIEIPAKWLYHHGDPTQVVLKIADDITVSPVVTEEAEENCKNFNDWLELLKKSPNKVGVLVKMFRTLHSNAPAEELDSKNIGGNIAGLGKYVRKDYGYAAKLIWDSASLNIPGRHLDYMRGMVRGRKNEGQKARPVSYSSVSDLRKEGK
jgi:hypothetical protein